ncbi:hypothetical protein GOODEAATRI_002955 [Goodea atripinnis]|uniref:Death domain containing 1 n=1 Tax=Goodea atripinnis TaxID=208336 RepID=A0ABV0N8T3_9TELE
MDRVTKIIPKLDAAVLRLTVHEESAGAAVRQESRDKDASCQTEDIRNPQSESSLELKEEVQDVCDQKNMLDSGFNSSNCGKKKDIEGEPHIRGQKRDFHYQACLLEAEEKDRENKTEKGNEAKWVTVRQLSATRYHTAPHVDLLGFAQADILYSSLSGQMDDSNKTTDVCFIRASADGLRCEVDDALSCLMVSGSEELVSRVIRVKVQAGDTFHFPVTVAVPFCLRHRSSHREVAVKFVDEEKRESYITPVTTDGARGGQKVLFSVISRVQPVDAILLAAVKSMNDAYELVVSASPLLHLTHPKSQPLRRPLTPCHLTALAEELEASACRHSVSVVLQCGRDNPHSVLLAALPSRDLGWELNRLRAQGCGGIVETSSEISLCEGDQLLLRFSGNITSTGGTLGKIFCLLAFLCQITQGLFRGFQILQSSTVAEPHDRLTFHCQRRNQLLVHLTEVDPFGNYSSPCYKGTAMLYRVTRAELEWRGDKAVLRDEKLLGNPVSEPLSDALLLWLSGELSQEETALLVSSLRLSRSAAQLVKLRSRDIPSDQAFHILAMWRRALPAVTRHPKASQLAQSLAKIGRPDLAREVLLREAELSLK